MIATNFNRRSPVTHPWVKTVLCSLLLAVAVQAEVPKEYHLKAAFLYNFTKFVEWPPDSFPDESDPIVIAVIGRNPFGEALENAVQGRRAAGREITIRSVTTVEETRGAHVLFIPAGEESRFAGMKPALLDAAVLTVGESDRFAALGGVITFVREADKVRFTINLGTAERCSLKLSAQLLKLATTVRRKS